MEKFDVANVIFEDGVIYLNTTGTSIEGKHYNVTLEELPDGRMRVTGEKPRFGFNWPSSNDYDLDLLEENSIVTYNEWPWSKKLKKKAKEGRIQYKQRYNKVYISQNISITRDKNTDGDV